MKPGSRVHVPVSIAETRISRRYDAIPSGTLYPNADEIKYLQRLVMYKVCLSSYTAFLISFCYSSYYSVHFNILYSLPIQDFAIIILNKPPKLPVKV